MTSMISYSVGFVTCTPPKINGLYLYKEYMGQ